MTYDPLGISEMRVMECAEQFQVACHQMADGGAVANPLMDGGPRRAEVQTSRTSNRMEDDLCNVPGKARQGSFKRGLFRFDPEMDSATPRGKVRLVGRPFANAFICPADWGAEHGGRWIVNRDPLAMELGYPADGGSFATPEEMLESLDAWLRGGAR